MKRANAFYIPRRKRVKDLTKEMQSIEIEHHRSKLQKLITQRRNKCHQALCNNKPIMQPLFKHLKKQYQQFSFVESNASTEPFISEQTKRRNWISNRAFSSFPNIKAGNGQFSFTNQQEITDKVLLNIKFLEYDRIIDESSPLKKIQQLKKKNQKSLHAPSRSRVTQMKKTFFQKIVRDKFNFYTINDYSSIKSSLLSKSKTSQEIKSSSQVQSKLRQVSKTIETEGNQKDYSTLQNSILKKSRPKLLEKEAFRSQNSAKSKVKSIGNQNKISISFQKNIDSMH